MISIVLPVYNGEKYLRESIKSILAQTYSDFELVVVNDCSTDSSVSIIKSFMEVDSRIKLINNTENQKLPRSLNIGFSHCCGDYFTWTSDDNMMLPNMLETMVSALENQNVDLVFSRCEIVNEQGKKIGMTQKYEDLDELYYNNIVLASFLYRKEIHFSLNGYDVNKFLVEDYDFWLRAYRAFRFAYIPEALYQIRFHKDNLGTRYLEEVKLRKIAVLKENLHLVSEPKIIDGIYSEICACYYEASNSFYARISNQKKRKVLMKQRIKDVVKKVIRWR